FSRRRRHTRFSRDWSSDVCSSDLIGFGAGFKNVGFSFGAPETANAIIELRGGAEIEEVILYHAGADVGQGAHTVFAQMAAEAVEIGRASCRESVCTAGGAVACTAR